jgi:hypothetical protein
VSGEGKEPQAIRKLQPGKLVIASHNKGKVREIAALIEGRGLEVVSAAELDRHDLLRERRTEGALGRRSVGLSGARRR